MWNLRCDVVKMQRRYETDDTLWNLPADGDEVGVRQWRQVGKPIKAAIKTLEHACISHRIQGAAMNALLERFAGFQYPAIALEDPFCRVKMLVCGSCNHRSNIPAYISICRGLCPTSLREFCVNELCTVMHCTAN